ncbi:MAG: PDZ domain-containing protein [Thermoanaerobaculia bacterium]|jgi:tricorn protease
MNRATPAAFTRLKFFLVLAAVLLLFVVAAGAQAPSGPPDGFYRYPAIGGGTIVFASEGDLWRVPAGGGVAERLTAHEGEERFPRISADGKWIAFTAQYEGNDDVYVMPSEGGEPLRLTWHPASDQALGWTADGRVLFRSKRDHPHADFRVFSIDPKGGIAQMVPLEPCAWISYEPGGSRIAMQKIGLEFHNWKRYKGGEAEQIWVGGLSPLAFTEVTKYDGKDAFPMWASDGRIYFVTDRWGRPNLGSMLPDGSDVKRLTTFDDYDVRWPAMGDGKIVFQHKMDIWAYDLTSGKVAQVAVKLPSDRLQLRERWVDPMKTLHSWGLSKDGERIVLEARGDVFVARTSKKGLIRRITDSSLSRTRVPSMSPDGKWIAAWTEVDGEEQLLLHSANNSVAPKQVGKVEPGWHFRAEWSPDGKSLAWGDHRYKLYVTDVATGASEAIDSAENEIRTYAWSPDSRYIAYEVAIRNGYSQVRIRDTKAKRSYDVSDPSVDSGSPAWDPKGKYLYYLADLVINPYLDRAEARFIVNNATVPVVVSLQADGALPFAPRSDVDPKKDEKPAAAKDEKSAKGASAPADAKDEKVEPIRIDFDEIASRVVQVPVASGNYAALRSIAGKLHFIGVENEGMMPEGAEAEGEQSGTLFTYDIEKEKLSTLATGVTDYELSMNGKVLVYQTEDGFTRVEAGATAAPKGDDAGDAKVDLAGWTMKINPRDEWKQIVHEAWRLQRDFFYDAKMHGVDWKGVWTQYGSLLDRVGSRDDVSDILGEMFGELSVGHTYYWGGDLRRGKTVGTGLLAADLEHDPTSGFWKISKIYAGDYPDLKWSSPLARPDLRVKPGMWLVAIDGRPLLKGEDYLRRLAGRAGVETELTINDKPSLDGARRIVVKPVGGDTNIRYATWIREMRAYVDKASGGKIGYIHLYDMGGLGLKQFSRDFPPQWEKPALIIDDRWNHGGFVASMIVAHLDRKPFSVYGTRYADGKVTEPSRSRERYLAALINRQGGSDCETLAQEFKDFKLGPVIGTRTWGGWVGIRGDKPFRDGGGSSQPEWGGWDPKGKEWQIEGHGVDPDVLLDLTPDGFLGGKDNQLDYAIGDLMKKLAADPLTLPQPPPIPPR